MVVVVVVVLGIVVVHVPVLRMHDDLTVIVATWMVRLGVHPAPEQRNGTANK
jgi:hypothetical protein